MASHIEEYFYPIPYHWYWHYLTQKAWDPATASITNIKVRKFYKAVNYKL